ncbi:hypothetical protein VFPPC_04772 [Pochonia chlamydosporia 170]|uniref:Uncharacterized protein n=1 Tax=Pochonia chlamydosporia 170 TaxID=1380566 RepID=A0A179FSG9_METCM|nr:hypothetical protein VFPPC_04772 [Pochonia chlamydosporia 170]OAQ68544.1 hypothetical protein VFPPC_04772 [Pochonia chlamydosporia 170]
MDTPTTSDAASTASSAANSSVVASDQPTYTTAGTIYKPSSSQPLQPPTRRGRLPKWSACGIPSDLALFPKTVLAGLSLKGPISRPLSALRQYTPLQQNYDRAVSPFGEQDHLAAKMPIDTPQIRSGNTPKALSASLGEQDSQDKVATLYQDHHSVDESSDNDMDDWDKDCFRRIPTQSWNNLASYPNPSQKRAQMRLKIGKGLRPPALDSAAMGTTAPTSPPAAALYNSPMVSSDAGGYSSNTDNYGKQDIFNLRRAQLDAAFKIEDPWVERNGTPAPALPNPVKLNSTGGESSKSSDKLVSASGVPLPLTAGPPGQRQYRPLAVEPTFKSLANAGRSSPVMSNPEDEAALMIASQTLFQAGIEDVSIDSLGSLLSVATLTSSSQAIPREDLGLQPRMKPPTIPTAEQELLYNSRAMKGSIERNKRWDHNEKLIQSKSWRDSSPDVRALYKPGTDRLTDEALAARNKRTEELWHSGSRSILNHAEDATLRRRQPQQDRNIGVIGDKRPRAVPVKVSEKVSVEEAQRIDVSEHARSLLEMAIHVVGRYQDKRTTNKPQKTF